LHTSAPRALPRETFSKSCSFARAIGGGDKWSRVCQNCKPADLPTYPVPNSLSLR
jgi:hypothetical protein